MNLENLNSMFKLILHAKSESLGSTDHFCRPQCVIRLRLSTELADPREVIAECLLC